MSDRETDRPALLGLLREHQPVYRAYGGITDDVYLHGCLCNWTPPGDDEATDRRLFEEHQAAVLTARGVRVGQEEGDAKQCEEAAEGVIQQLERITADVKDLRSRFERALTKIDEVCDSAALRESGR